MTEQKIIDLLESVRGNRHDLLAMITFLAVCYPQKFQNSNALKCYETTDLTKAKEVYLYKMKTRFDNYWRKYIEKICERKK